MWKKNQIVMITRHYPNGKKSRLIGAISSMEPADDKGRVYCTLRPVGSALAKEYRAKYCEVDGFNYQGHTNCFSVEYGFACNHLHPDTTVILGELPPPRPISMWYPAPGNTGYDLMC